MNDKLEQEIEEVEKQFIAEKKSFTALDVGNELKKKGINARQRKVSPIVRGHYENNDNKDVNNDVYSGTGYTRTLIPVKNSSVKAFLYFHIDNEPSNYTDTEQDPLPWEPGKAMFQNGNGAVDDAVDAGNDGNNGDDLVGKTAAGTQQSNNGTSTGNMTLDSVVGSKNSSVYHDSGCMYASRIKQHNLVSFSDSGDAVSDGYRKCMRE